MDESDVGEYYREPGLTDAQARQLLLDDTVLPDGLTAEEEREACRALKGSMLRQEVYALDGTDRGEASLHGHRAELHHPSVCSRRPGTATPCSSPMPAKPSAITTSATPPIRASAHALTLEVDDFGNVLKSAAIGYGRRQPDLTLLGRTDQAKADARSLITYTENRVTNAIEADDDYRTPLPCEIANV